MSQTNQICQYCGAALEPEAVTCVRCGSPVAPPPTPVYNPDQPAYTVVPPEAPLPKPAYTPPPQVEVPSQPAYNPPPPAYQPPAPAAANPNKTTALIVEILAGMFGFLGIGWIIAGKTGLGIGLLIGYWVFLAIYVVILTLLATVTLGFGYLGLCCLPIVPIASGMILNSQIK
jgi:hypothetical protein